MSSKIHEDFSSHLWDLSTKRDRNSAPTMLSKSGIYWKNGIACSIKAIISGCTPLELEEFELATEHHTTRARASFAHLCT
jgi:hypothetical protein